jgi:hypothetical protein
MNGWVTRLARDRVCRAMLRDRIVLVTPVTGFFTEHTADEVPV